MVDQKSREKKKKKEKEKKVKKRVDGALTTTQQGHLLM